MVFMLRVRLLEEMGAEPQYGGAGAGSPTPPENEHEKEESKPVDKLNQKQESAIKKIDNTIKMP